jgi:MFS transporter, PAT family, beta-lactamase induction signal transducer AmpG
VPANRRLPPVWLMGLSNSSFGLYSGITFFAIPQLLAARHVDETRIAGITAAALFPYFWAFVLGPMLDVRFSRRFYAIFFAALEAVLVAVALLNQDHLWVLESALVAGSASSQLAGSALGGWLSAICPREIENKVSAWYTIANISGTGITAVLGGELARNLSLGLAAFLLGLIVFLPTAIFLMMPAPGPDRRLAGESFFEFNREILALLRRREVLVALLLFVSPCGSFALTNLLSGLGNDFHASARMVSLAGGVGAVVPGILGCLLFPLVARWVPLRLIYLGNGILGGIFTLTLIALPHAPWTFVIALIGEFLFQAASYATLAGITFEAIGKDNPLAATNFTFLIASSNIPITYMVLLDDRGYAKGGVTWALATDALVSIVSCVLLGLLLVRRRGRATNDAMDKTPEAVPVEESL